MKYKLWAKKDNDGIVISEATKLDIYDDKAEEILARNDFIGRGSGGRNIGNKIKVLDAYLLKKLNIDHNNFCEEKPTGYRNVDVYFDDYENVMEIQNPRTKKFKSKFKNLY